MENGGIPNGVGSHLHNGEAATKVTNGAGSGGHKRSLSGSILSKLSFLRASADNVPAQANNDPPSPERHRDETTPKKTVGAMAYVEQQQKTRRRKGSLRKAALLGRGAQREIREMEASPLHIHDPTPIRFTGSVNPMSLEGLHQSDGQESDTSDITPRASMDGYARSPEISAMQPLPTLNATEGQQISPTNTSSPILTYISTTDEDDVLSIPKHHPPPLRNEPPLSSSSESYFQGGSASVKRRRSAHKAASPLSLGGLVANPLPNPDADWDYSATEWWGWVVLIVTWIVFVVGMGSCLDVWSWAWDVGEVPSAPLELSDDHTLPIVGYYPALIILTGVMSWVWVIVAWVGMKYFRHAKISGD